jgi:hypothetical protein
MTERRYGRGEDLVKHARAENHQSKKNLALLAMFAVLIFNYQLTPGATIDFGNCGGAS